jgi:hypothetical protein
MSEATSGSRGKDRLLPQDIARELASEEPRMGDSHRPQHHPPHTREIKNGRDDLDTRERAALSQAGTLRKGRRAAGDPPGSDQSVRRSDSRMPRHTRPL